MEDFRKTTLPVTTTVLKIDEFTWLISPVELFHQIGRESKSSMHSRFTYFVGYCNGSVGYLPTQQSHSEGGYEPNTTHFAPVGEKIYVKQVEKLLAGLY